MCALGFGVIVCRAALQPSALSAERWHPRSFLCLVVRARGPKKPNRHAPLACLLLLSLALAPADSELIMPSGKGVRERRRWRGRGRSNCLCVRLSSQPRASPMRSMRLFCPEHGLPPVWIGRSVTHRASPARPPPETDCKQSISSRLCKIYAASDSNNSASRVVACQKDALETVSVRP